MIKEVAVRRDMTESDVRKALCTCFNFSSDTNIVYHQVHRDNSLKNNEEQSVDGSGIIRLAGSGSLYVRVQELSKCLTHGSSSSSTSSPIPFRDPSSPSNTSVRKLLERTDKILADLKVFYCIAHLKLASRES